VQARERPEQLPFLQHPICHLPAGFGMCSWRRL
jgi:hypothetical protein